MTWPVEAPRLSISRVHPEAILPRRMSESSAGLDLCACLDQGEVLSLAPGARTLVPSGWAMAVPQGWEIQVRPRSGLALREGITIPNSPGTIDADYRGEVKVILCNGGDAAFEIRHGDRIAQLVVAPIALVTPELVERLPDSTRGAGGFGSTGVARDTRKDLPQEEDPRGSSTS